MDRVQGKVRAISGRERAGRWEKRAVRKGRGMKRGKRKIILGELPVLLKQVAIIKLPLVFDFGVKKYEEYDYESD